MNCLCTHNRNVCSILLLQWLLFRMLVVPAGYNTYTIVFYLLSGLVIGSLLATAWIAVVMKGSDSNSAWLNRLVRALQLFAMVIYTMFWPAVLDFFCFLWDCRWSNIAAGSPPTHIYFSDHSEPRCVLLFSVFDVAVAVPYQVGNSFVGQQ